MFTRLENQINYSANYNACKSHIRSPRLVKTKRIPWLFTAIIVWRTDLTDENRNSGSTFLRNPVAAFLTMPCTDVCVDTEINIPYLCFPICFSFHFIILFFFYQALVGRKVDEPYVRIDWWQSIDTVAKKLIHFAFSVLTSSGGSTWNGCLFQVNVYKTVEISWVEACEG